MNSGNFGLAFRIRNIAASNSTTEIDSVSLTITDSNPIVTPVISKSVTANKLNNGYEVVWKVASEEEVDHYEVEKSTDGLRFTKPGQVIAEKKQTYRHVDASPSNTISYYRIKSIETDLQFKYSTTITVGEDRTGAALKVFPLPAKSSVTLQHDRATAGVKIVVISEEGRILQQVIPVPKPLKPG